VSREEVGARLLRLLAMVPWIASQGRGATVAELVERFGGSPARIAKDLTLLSGVDVAGLHSVSIWVEDDGRWRVDQYGHLGDPYRLTAVEGLAVTVAAKALLDVPGTDHEGPLATALAKLRRALEDVEGLEVDLDEPPFLEEVRAAAAERERVAIEYHSAARDEVTQREVEPLAVFNARGRWHTLAYCHLAEGERDFRVDRIRALRRTGEHFEPRELTMRTGVSFQPAGTTAVTLEVGPGQEWVLDSYPVRDVADLGEGRWRLTLDVGGPAWLESVLLRLGPRAQVVSPPELVHAGRSAAARLLALYE